MNDKELDNKEYYKKIVKELQEKAKEKRESFREGLKSYNSPSKVRNLMITYEERYATELEEERWLDFWEKDKRHIYKDLPKQFHDDLERVISLKDKYSEEISIPTRVLTEVEKMHFAEKHSKKFDKLFEEYKIYVGDPCVGLEQLVNYQALERYDARLKAKLNLEQELVLIKK